MSKVLIEEQTLYDIGDAIREINGSSTTYKPSEMASAIDVIGQTSQGPLHFINPSTLDYCSSFSIKSPAATPFDIPYVYKVYRDNADYIPILSTSFDSNNTTAIDISGNGAGVIGICFLRPVPAGTYSKLYINLKIANTNTTKSVTSICFFPSTSTSVFNSDGWVSLDASGRALKSDILKFVQLASKSQYTADFNNNPSSSDINAQDGVTINSTNPISLDSQVVEIDLSGIQTEFIVAIESWNNHTIIRELYLE